MPLPIDRASLVAQLHALGIRPGDVLIVHTAFSAVRPVEDGPEGLIAALQAALGPAGTLVMPSLADTDDPFDAVATPCAGMGIVAETFRRLPGVRRTDSPHAFAARGPLAAAITAPQPLEVPHGPDSPVGRVHDLDGRILLLGVGHDANTTLHLAEHLAGVPYARPCTTRVREGEAIVERHYTEPDHCCQGFARADAWLEPLGLQPRGVVGHGVARLMRSRDLVEVALYHLRRDATVFLHPRGRCDECDEAWDSIPAHG